jgi:hypothetical protein
MRRRCRNPFPTRLKSRWNIPTSSISARSSIHRALNRQSRSQGRYRSSRPARPGGHRIAEGTEQHGKLIGRPIYLNASPLPRMTTLQGFLHLDLGIHPNWL